MLNSVLYYIRYRTYSTIHEIKTRTLIFISPFDFKIN